jgi:hypothetical protein
VTHVTQQQRAQIADLKAAGLSFVRIAQQTGIPMGTCKTLYYKDRPPAPPPKRAKGGQFKTRSPAGRKPAGATAQSDKARTAACRARKRERMVQLAGNLSAANDGELVAMLAQAIRSSDTSMVQAIVFELHGRYCGNS